LNDPARCPRSNDPPRGEFDKKKAKRNCARRCRQGMGHAPGTVEKGTKGGLQHCYIEKRSEDPHPKPNKLKVVGYGGKLLEEKRRGKDTLVLALSASGSWSKNGRRKLIPRRKKPPKEGDWEGAAGARSLKKRRQRTATWGQGDVWKMAEV